MAKKNLPARRTPVKQTPTYKDLESKFDRARNELKTLRAEKRQQTLPALLDAGATQFGAGTVGFVKGATGFSDLMGIPLEVVSGVPTIMLGALLKSPRTIHTGGGMLAPYTADYFEEMAKDLFSE